MWPQAPPPRVDPPDDPREPTSTPTEEKLRSAFSEPHSGQSGFLASEYSDMDMRTSKDCPQSGHR